MSTVRFIADLHLGHKTIPEKSGKHRGGVKTVDEHNEWIISQWNSVVGKRDLTYVLGDVAWSKDALKLVKRLNGVKHLVMGNHDELPNSLYLEYFNRVDGLVKYKGYWLSHAPIAITCLRNLKNIHGHTHNNIIANSYCYACVSVEAINGIPITLEDIENKLKEHRSNKFTITDKTLGDLDRKMIFDRN